MLYNIYLLLIYFIHSSFYLLITYPILTLFSSLSLLVTTSLFSIQDILLIYFIHYLYSQDSWESLGLQGDQTNQSPKKSTLNIHWKDWCWSWNSNTLATWFEEMSHWFMTPSISQCADSLTCWEGLKAGREGGGRGWDGWMASLKGSYMARNSLELKPPSRSSPPF